MIIELFDWSCRTADENISQFDSTGMLYFTEARAIEDALLVRIYLSQQDQWIKFIVFRMSIYYERIEWCPIDEPNQWQVNIRFIFKTVSKTVANNDDEGQVRDEPLSLSLSPLCIVLILTFFSPKIGYGKSISIHSTLIEQFRRLIVNSTRDCLRATLFFQDERKSSAQRQISHCHRVKAICTIILWKKKKVNDISLSLTNDFARFCQLDGSHRLLSASIDFNFQLN